MLWRTLLLLRTASVRLGFAIGQLRPLRAAAVLATAQGDRLTGNLAILRDELARRTPAIEIIEVTSVARWRGWMGRGTSLWQNAVAGYRLATSRLVVVDDDYFPLYVVRPRLGTTVVQAWHACGAFKRFGYSLVDKAFGADEQTLSRVRIHANYDVCLVSSMSVAADYAEAFGQPLDRFRADLGIPRTDLLFGEERIERISADLRHRYALPADKRVVLYAPTFRGVGVREARADGFPDWQALRDALADDHVLLVRLHPFVRDGLVIDRELDGFLIDVSGDPDVNDLLHVADVLVTDYSSVIFEYALLGRPMVFFAPDLDAYEHERGFYFDYRAGVPGPVVKTTSGLAAVLRERAFDTDVVGAFARRYFDVADGASTARVVDELLLPALHR